MLLLVILIKQDCYGYKIIKLIKNYSNDLIIFKDGTMYLTIVYFKQKYLVFSIHHMLILIFNVTIITATNIVSKHHMLLIST